MSTENERRYYDVLKKIARGYMTTEQLHKRGPKEYALSYEECLEMSYDNLQAEAADAIRGRRRPSVKATKIDPNNDPRNDSYAETDKPMSGR